MELEPIGITSIALGLIGSEMIWCNVDVSRVDRVRDDRCNVDRCNVDRSRQGELP